MKIERINENQIRCTLTREDLMDREIKISELAYGSDKAKSLFRDMMQQAAYEFGFEADDIPLMVEAVPINAECLVLTITKVEDPEELDTRFSKFAPSVLDDDAEDEDDDMDSFMSASDHPFPETPHNPEAFTDSTLSMGRQKEPLPEAKKQSEAGEAQEITSLTRLFSFSSLDKITTIAGILRNSYDGVNSLYKNPSTGTYLLLVGQSGMPLASFGKVCNILSEYGQTEKNLSATAAFLDEHYDLMIKDCALQKLVLMLLPEDK